MTHETKKWNHHDGPKYNPQLVMIESSTSTINGMGGANSLLDDIDTVELFNRDTLYFNGQQQWLRFMEEKRNRFRRDRKKISIIIFMAILLCSFLTLVFLISGLMNYVHELQDETIYDGYLDQQTFVEQWHKKEQCSRVSPQWRIDCNPDLPITRERCLARGCCWDPHHQNSNSAVTEVELNTDTGVLPPIDIPYCFYGRDYRGYRVVENLTTENDLNIHLERIQPSGFPADIRRLTVQVHQHGAHMVRITVTDREKSRYRVPIPELNIPAAESGTPLYRVEFTTSGSGQDDDRIAIRRRSTNKTVFDLNLSVMVYADQFIQATSRLPSDCIYGLGEHREPFRKAANWKRYTMLNRDQYPIPDAALYGSHPFYLSVEETELGRPASGVFLFNSNAMDVITQPAPAITFRTTGGVLDFFIFLGPTPEMVTQQYHRLIGTPNMPPYWALGFHLSRFGYRDMAHLNETFIRNQNARIPMDVQWTDIDIMLRNNDFTLDRTRFQRLPEFIANVLHPNGLRYIPMFDPGISDSESGYEPYDLGIKMDVFIRNSTGQLFRGKVWNYNSTVWPDFFHPNATDYWTRLFADYHRDVLQFDGAWIDMNEPSNMITGQMNGLGCPATGGWKEPPYTPGMTAPQLTLNWHTVCMSARHHGDRLHYDLHNLYGFQEAIITNQALKTVLGQEKRPFIISRSTAPGHGHYANHWSGDIVSDWPSMKWSIASMLNFNLFGIPMVGADICGFNGNTTDELCARWHQLGAFYPFARNHNTDDAVDQDPAAMSPRVIRSARNALLMRYAHLPYLYTLFWRVSRTDGNGGGGTVVRPLFFEFPADPIAYRIDGQFMWGAGLMVAPVLAPNQTTVEVYFPPGVWYFVGTFEQFVVSGTAGQFRRTVVTDAYPNVFYRAGTIIPVQPAQQTTDQMRRGHFTLVVALESQSSSASGSLYWDAGDGPASNNEYNHYQFEVNEHTMKIKADHLGYATKQRLQQIIVLGFHKPPKVVRVNERILDGSHLQYDHQRNTLTMAELYLDLYPAITGNKIEYTIIWSF